MNFQKINDFRSSLRYRPWGILVGVSVSYPTRAVAQLLGESRAYVPDDIFNIIFLNENVWILNEISLRFVPKGQINDIPASVQIMAWCWPGNKPLSETMMVSLLTHISVTRPECVKFGKNMPYLHYPSQWLYCTGGHCNVIHNESNHNALINICWGVMAILNWQLTMFTAAWTNADW